jgi:mono/diheme cytochrome c family protein
MDQWHRLTAQRLLVERGVTEVAVSLRTMLRESPTPWARLHALWTLDGLAIATRDDMERALDDEHPAVRSAACMVLEPHLDAPSVDRLAGLVSRGPMLVRAQAALSLGADLDVAFDSLVRLATTEASDAVVRSAIVSSLAPRAGAALAALTRDASWPSDDASRAVLSELGDAALRGSQGKQLLELIATLGPDRASLAELVLARVGAWQRINDARPRTLTLGAEPIGWSMMIESAPGRVGDLATKVDRYLAWPGRTLNVPVALTSDQAQSMARGGRLYTYCQGCHGASGEGMGNQYPPLAGSPRVLGDPSLLARVLLHGLEGPLEREGRVFQESMPPAPLGSDRDFAAVMTYIRRSWGNDVEAVDASLVERVRRETRGRNRPWRVDELE